MVSMKKFLYALSHSPFLQEFQPKPKKRKTRHKSRLLAQKEAFKSSFHSPESRTGTHTDLSDAESSVDRLKSESRSRNKLDNNRNKLNADHIKCEHNESSQDGDYSGDTSSVHFTKQSSTDRGVKRKANEDDDISQELSELSERLSSHGNKTNEEDSVLSSRSNSPMSSSSESIIEEDDEDDDVDDCSRIDGEDEVEEEGRNDSSSTATSTAGK